MTRRSPAVGVRVFRATAMTDLPGLLAFVDTACDAFSADEDVRFAMRLAVEEVFANILEHGYRGNGPVEATVDGGPRCVRVCLRDQAPPFDPADAPAPDLRSPLEERDPGGLGWHLVRQFVDELEHRPAPGGGNTYILVKQLPARAPDP
jgi:anti-sigma regulatory factor (Ser/Thr protein kinase)